MSDSTSAIPPPNVITSAELDEIAESMQAVEDHYLAAERQMVATTPCPVCGGTGGGDYGSIGGAGCYGCEGTGQVTDEFAENKIGELPSAFKNLRLEYKAVRGQLEAHNASVVAQHEFDKAEHLYKTWEPAQEGDINPPEPPAGDRPVIVPAPDAAVIARVAALAKVELPKVKEEISAKVRAHREEKQALAAGEEEVASMRRRLEALERKERARLASGKGKGKKGGGMGGEFSDEELDDEIERANGE